MFSKDQDQSCQDLNVPDLLIRSHLNVKQDKGLSGVPCNHALFPQAVKSNVFCSSILKKSKLGIDRTEEIAYY